jgi:CheY-like chemotaxis protein/anti-sigma regulatory factor (Ser/Thr protein kinase)
MELYDNIASMSRFSAQAKDLEFYHSFDPKVPQVIYGDDVRIRQVLTNIINNAIKYTRQGYVDFTVSAAVREGGDYLVFTVKDTGIGIKKEDFPKLFGNFQQLDSERNRGIVGTGLGLAITKNLVTMMNGDISLESEYGVGSVFTILLPLVPGDPGQVERKGLNALIKASADVAVLVVDDNQINLKVALAFLATHSIKADTATSGPEAIEKIAQKNYDLVFMDHMMPGMDGLEATARIRAMEGKRFKEMPIIALTANAVSGAKESFLAAGMNDSLFKPIDAADLNRKLEKWLPPDKFSWVEIHTGGEKPGHDSTRDDAAVIDRKTAVHNIGGSEELYDQLLGSFRNDHGGDFEKIDAALKSRDLTLAHRLAHTLKSTAGLIGADRLRQVSFEIEKALAHEDLGEAEKQLPHLKMEFAAVIRELALLVPVLIAGEGSDTGNGPGGAFTADTAKMRDLAERLRPLLETGNTGSLRLVDEIRTVFPPKEGGELIKQIEDFEFKRALEVLGRILLM